MVCHLDSFLGTLLTTLLLLTPGIVVVLLLFLTRRGRVLRLVVDVGDLVDGEPGALAAADAGATAAAAAVRGDDGGDDASLLALLLPLGRLPSSSFPIEADEEVRLAPLSLSKAMVS